MKLLKFFLRTLFTLILLLVIAGALLVVFIKPNHLKQVISDQVQTTTGKTLVFNGDLSWKFWPSLGLGVNQAILGQDKAYNNLPLIQLDDAMVGVKVAPLFSKKVIVDNLSLKRLEINFVKNSAGKMNWQTLKQATSTSTPKNPANNAKDLPQNPVNASQDSPKIPLNFQLNIPAIYANYIQINWLNLGNHAKNLFQARNFKASVEANQNTVKINPIKANIYGGNFSGDVLVKLDQKNIAAQATLNQVNIQALLKDLANYSNITGTANVTTNLITKNFDFNQNEGNVTFDIDNGVIKFVNILKLVEIGQAVRSGKMIALKNLGDLGQTSFGSLKGTLSVKNNLITIKSIQLLSDVMEAKAKGTLNLNSHKIDLNIDAWLKKDPEKTVPIEISGDMRHPTISLSQTAILKTVLKHQEKRIKKVLNEKLGKTLGKLFG